LVFKKALKGKKREVFKSHI